MSDDSYSIEKEETTDVQTSKYVRVEAPTQDEAKDLFDEVWNE